jgi:hypothetical protein
MDRYPSRTAGREMRRLQRLGIGPLVCFRCGYIDPIALIRVKVEWLVAKGLPKSIFEDHHIVGEKHDPDLTVLICRNCHALATEGLLRAGVSMQAAPDDDTRDALRLEALAVWFADVAESLWKWAAEKRNREGGNG